MTARIRSHNLTDGSKVYDVMIFQTTAGRGDVVHLHAESREAAEALLDAIGKYTDEEIV